MFEVFAVISVMCCREDGVDFMVIQCGVTGRYVCDCRELGGSFSINIFALYFYDRNPTRKELDFDSNLE